MEDILGFISKKNISIHQEKHDENVYGMVQFKSTWPGQMITWTVFYRHFLQPGKDFMTPWNHFFRHR